MRKDGIKVNKVNSDMYRKLVCEPAFLVFVKKYRLDIFLNTIIKNITSRIMSKYIKSCKLISKKDNNFISMKAKKVSIHSPIQIIESERTNLKPSNFLSIKNINNLYKHNIV